MNSKLRTLHTDDQTGDFLMEAPYTDSVKGVISSVMIMVSGIKNKYGCPVVNPPEMNKELDEVYFKAEKAIRQAVGEEMLELVSDDEPIAESPQRPIPDFEALHRNKLRAELRQKIKQWSEETTNG